MKRNSDSAFTLVELLIVLGILGILYGLAAWAVRGSDERQAADAFHAVLQEARLESVNRNRPIGVVWNLAAGTASVVEGDATAPSCTVNTTFVRSLSLNEFRGVSVTTDLGDDGVLWFPSGRGQSCAATTLASTTTFTTASGSAEVVISDGGRIEVQ